MSCHSLVCQWVGILPIVIQLRLEIGLPHVNTHKKMTVLQLLHSVVPQFPLNYWNLIIAVSFLVATSFCISCSQCVLLFSSGWLPFCLIQGQLSLLQWINLQWCCIYEELLFFQAEARLAAKRAARAEARSIRLKELERQQQEGGNVCYSRWVSWTDCRIRDMPA